jgi:hypothetical protein
MRVKILISAILLVLLTGCVEDDERDIKMLKNAGYVNPQITLHSSMNCGDPTSPTGIFHREFKAEKNGKEIKGVICAGPFGDTIKDER